MWEFIRQYWNAGFEILILSVAIYYGYLYFKGTRGAKVLTGLALLVLALTLVSQALDLRVIQLIIGKSSVVLATALVVIFQPELRRALAEIGSHHFLTSASQKNETIEVLTETVFELSHKQFGALIAIERDTDIKVFAETGILLDSEFTPELALTIFHPKTALHDGGVILRNDRILSAACIFPVSQREDLDRTLGLRHRAALGLTEESDAIAIVVSEETGTVSIGYQGTIKRDYDRKSFRKRLNQLLLLEKYEKTAAEQLESEDSLDDRRNDGLVSDQGRS